MFAPIISSGIVSQDPKAFCGLGIKPEPELNPDDDDVSVDDEDDDCIIRDTDISSMSSINRGFEVVLTKTSSGLGIRVAEHKATGALFHFTLILGSSHSFSNCFLRYLIRITGSIRITGTSQDLLQRGTKKIAIGDSILGIDSEDVSSWKMTQILGRLSLVPEGSEIRLFLERQRNHGGRGDSGSAAGGSLLVLRNPSAFSSLTGDAEESQLSRQPSVVLGSASFVSPLDDDDTDKTEIVDRIIQKKLEAFEIKEKQRILKETGKNASFRSFFEKEEKPVFGTTIHI